MFNMVSPLSSPQIKFHLTKSHCRLQYVDYQHFAPWELANAVPSPTQFTALSLTHIRQWSQYHGMFAPFT